MTQHSTSQRRTGLPFRMVLAMILAAIAVLSVGCGGADGGSDLPSAPAFSGIALDGSEVSNATFAGRPAVLVFWGTW